MKVPWRHVYGAGWLARIGFTMSLFVSDLAFEDEALLQTAKVGILAASVLSGASGWLLLRGATAPPLAEEAEEQEWLPSRLSQNADRRPAPVTEVAASD
jgi:hypothetical protein